MDNKGIYLNGKNAYVTLPAEVSAGKSVYTLELTFSTTQKVASSADWNAPCICGFLNYGGKVIDITNNDGNVALGVAGGNVGREMLADGKIHHVAIVSDGAIVKGYNEKNQYQTTGKAEKLDNVAINLGVGKPQCNAYAECIIYEVRFWDIAKTPERLGETIKGNEARLVAWYKCDQSTGNMLLDSTGNFHANIIGDVEFLNKNNNNIFVPFKYINPGFGDLFNVVGTGMTQLYNSAMSRNLKGICFYIGAFPDVIFLKPSQEYWVSFYVYVDANYSSTYDLVEFRTAKNTIKFDRYYNSDDRSFKLRVCINGSYLPILSREQISCYEGRHVEIYIKKDNENSIVNIWMDGILIVDSKCILEDDDGFTEFAFLPCSYFVYSDIVIQNTGRIGNMRVDVLPRKANTGVCEWELAYPVGFKISADDNIQSTRTYIFTKEMFDLAGKIERVRVSQYGNKAAIFKFCLFRKNLETGKYNAVQTTNELTTTKNGVQEIQLAIPFTVKPGDFFGFYSTGNFHCFRLDNACLVFENSDKTNASEIDIFAQATSYNYPPSVHAIFIPNDKSEGYNKTLVLQENLENYVSFSTDVTDRKLLFGLDLSNVKVGRIDSIAVTDIARCETESIITELAATIKSGEETYVEKTVKLTTADRKHILGVYAKNPIKNTDWHFNDLLNMQFGITAKN